MRTVRRWISGMLCLLLGVMAYAPEAHTANQALVNEAFVRVVHGSPDAPAVDVYTNGNLAFEALTFKTISPYVSTRIGNVLVQIVPQGKTLAQGPIVISTTVV